MFYYNTAKNLARGINASNYDADGDFLYINICKN